MPEEEKFEAEIEGEEEIEGAAEEEAGGEDQTRWFKRTMMVKYRTLRRLTQAKVGEGIYKSRDTVRNYERGRAKIPATCTSDLIRVLKYPEDVAAYMRILARLKGGELPIEAAGRYNALYGELCEQYMGEIFEWAPILFPSLLQTYAYYDGLACAVDVLTTDERRKSGWAFRSEREKTLTGREDQPVVQYLIGEAAFYFLSKESRALQIEQLDFLTAHEDLPGWEIRVLPDPWINIMSSFSCYSPGNPKQFPEAGPKVVYTALAHTSWVFQDEHRIAVYDDWRHEKWPRSIGYKEYRDAYWRDRLA
ncbi:Scr1 family TA system antitoxin-like transcriptional regulator [Glycomyces dulcitolivorans]|uniref:Scr1 family TA system antitoxin-like transcriptional regulator n=1 Tax=Glycomyces dulcitolivorans TaxID=2200759 RepID=UPI000DD3BB87|nr:Scr1 family TA system antitoxin-like transcriptional regulator [Glycomyces dulcitolivorans]